MNGALRIQDKFIKMPLSSRISSMEGAWQLGGEGAGGGSASLDTSANTVLKARREGVVWY